MSGFALPDRYRFQAKNETGVAVDFTVNVNRQKLSSTGGVVFESTGAWTQVLSSTGVANGSVANGTEQDNLTDKFLGGDGELVVSTTGAASGDSHLYFQTKGSTTFPDDETGSVLASIESTAAGTFRKTFPF